MFLYETHLHTSPVSRCAQASVRETVEFYKSEGYDGIFITNHFVEPHGEVSHSYRTCIEFLFSDYEEAVKLGNQVGLSVFFGTELSHHGTDFLVFGLDKEWWLSHAEIARFDIHERLELMAKSGALIIQAHPFREAMYIDCIRLFPREVHGVEVFNANRIAFENDMAAQYAKNYELLPFAGSDNHRAGKQPQLGGMQSDTPIRDEKDFVNRVKNGEMTLFTRKNNI